MGDEWIIAHTAEVVWSVVLPSRSSSCLLADLGHGRDTSDIPDDSDAQGKLVLGYVEPGSTNEHLDIG